MERVLGCNQSKQPWHSFVCSVAPEDVPLCLIKAKTQIEQRVYLIDLCSLEIVLTFYYTFLFVR